MTQATTVKSIVQNYLDRGGSMMDEAEYQKYKLAILLDWLDREELFAIRTVQNSAGCWIQIPERQPAVMSCCYEECTYNTIDVLQAVEHLVTHYGQWFDGGSKVNNS